ncbi:MAG: hypothetical protein J6Q58_01440 [Clostridia bacterium]|nr:hypothetical protein [Clostridia bacterium]
MKKQRFDPYSNYYYKLNKRKNRRAKLFTILFVLFSISIVIFFSISFSNFLTVSKIVNINSNFIYEDKSVYALSLDTSNNLSEAESKSESIKKQGGAGYILNKGANEFKIISSIYLSEKDAKSVKENLENNGTICEIIKINLPALNFKVSVTNKSSEILNNGISIFYSSYKKLYNLSVDYDSNKIDLVALKTSLNNLQSENQKIIDKFNVKFNMSNNIYILYVKIYLQRANDIIKNLESLDESVNFSSEIKYAYCNILNQYIDLYNEML